MNVPLPEGVTNCIFVAGLSDTAGFQSGTPLVHFFQEITLKPTFRLSLQHFENQTEFFKIFCIPKESDSINSDCWIPKSEMWVKNCISVVPDFLTGTESVFKNTG
ncbi:MAG: hypothetical protein V2I97_21470 [Desulfococcaceae bacterium]|jgi:hypothetical protein|nr:hypothetical protein [Desulfococcaceae bacterium]